MFGVKLAAKLSCHMKCIRTFYIATKDNKRVIKCLVSDVVVTLQAKMAFHVANAKLETFVLIDLMVVRGNCKTFLKRKVIMLVFACMGVSNISFSNTIVIYNNIKWFGGVRSFRRKCAG